MICKRSWIVRVKQLTLRKGFGDKSLAAMVCAHSAELAVKRKSNAREIIIKSTQRASTDQWLSWVLTKSKRRNITNKMSKVKSSNIKMTNLW